MEMWYIGVYPKIVTEVLLYNLNRSIMLITQDIVEKIKKQLFDLNGECLTQLGVWLVDIILDDNKHELDVIDCGYDVSTYARKSDDGYDLSQYFKVQDFLDNEYTGNTKATHMSGSGMMAETYYIHFRDEVDNLWFDYIYGQFPEIKLRDDEGYMDDDVYDQLGSNKIDQYALLQYFGNLDLHMCYKLYLSKTLEVRKEWEMQQEIEKQERKEYTKNLQNFATEVLPLLKDFNDKEKIEMKNSKTLFSFLNELIIKHGKEKVGAALCFHKFNCSSSVQGKINNLTNN